MSRVLARPKRYEGIASGQNHAVGTESREIRRRIEDFWGALQIVMSVEPRRAAVRTLTEIVKDCSVENWDSEGARPVNERTYAEALKFLAALPLTIRVPDVIPEPNGSIGFEWRYGPNAIFVAAVDGTQKISYAGLYGRGSSAHGTENFIDAIPETIMSNLQRVRELQEVR
jgi:hypothetical protein